MTADSKHAFVGDAMVVYQNADSEWEAYDAWGSGSASKFFNRDYDLSVDPGSTPEYNNVQLISRVVSGGVTIKVKRLMEPDRWDSL